MKRCLKCDERFAGRTWACPACGYLPPHGGQVLSFAPEAADRNGGFERAGFEGLATIEEDSAWFRARNRLLVWALRRYYPGAQSLCEVGCGTGYVLAGFRRAFPALGLTGAELFAEGLEFARQRVPDATLFQLDARDMPFDQEFDVVGAFDVLEHVDDDGSVLRGMRDAVAPGGGVMITVPQHGRLWGPSDDYAHHRRRYSNRSLRAKVRSAGLTVERITSFVSFALPLMMVSRLRARGKQTTYDPRREHDEARRINLLLDSLAAADFALIRRGVSLPVGGSLLVVARRQDA
jgi:SAM-dependent methyltransferase